jgi:isopenicillin N synthase-like dioxygenase
MAHSSVSVTTTERLAEEEIPVLDLGPFLAGEAGALDRLGRQLYKASTEVGFYYVKNHGIAQDLIGCTFREAKRFHDLPLDEKRKIKVDANKIGYFEVGSSVTKHSDLAKNAKPNLYAAFCMRRELAPDDPDILAGVPYRALNRWPENLPGFRENMVAYGEAMEALGMRMLPILARALDLPADYFAASFEKPLVNLQLNYYPPQPHFYDDQYGIAPHTDRGFITILSQAQVPGLEIRTVDGRWVVAPVLPGHFLINTGDLLRHWTNDIFLSTPHRVVNLSGGERFSIPFFFKPDLPTRVECIPTCQSAERPAKYSPTTVLEFYDSFVKSNYPDVVAAQSKVKASFMAANE